MDDRMNDSVITLLRTTFDVKAAELDVDDRTDVDRPVLIPFPHVSTGGGHRPRRNVLAMAACFALVAGGAGAVIAFRADAPSGSGTATTTSGPPTPVVNPPVAGDPAQVQWYLPGVVPDGYSLVEISAQSFAANDLASAVAGPEDSWTRTADDGTITGTIQVGFGFHADAGPPLESPTATVHGVPAVVLGSGDGTESWTVTWEENGRRFHVIVFGLPESDAVAIADATAVTGDRTSLDPASVPDGFVVEPMNGASGAPPPVYIGLASESGGPDIMISIDPAPSSTPNTTPDGSSADGTAVDDAELRTIDGVEYRIDKSDSMFGGFVSVTWTADGRLFGVRGHTAEETILAVALALQPATAEEAAAAADEVSARIQQHPISAEAEFDDGLRVTARGFDDMPGVFALCVESPTPECVHSGGEDPNPESMVEVFTIDEHRVLIGWGLGATDFTVSDGSPLTEVESSDGSSFLRVDVADGQPIPMLEWTEGDANRGSSPSVRIRP